MSDGENNPKLGGQSNTPPDNEKSPSDKDREAKEEALIEAAWQKAWSDAAKSAEKFK